MTRNSLIANIGAKLLALQLWTQYIDNALHFSGGRQVEGTEWDDTNGRFDSSLRNEFIELLQ